MAHHHHHQSVKNLEIPFFLNLGFKIFEAIGGYMVNSVAILSDAVQYLSDDGFLKGTAWYLDSKSRQSEARQCKPRPETKKRQSPVTIQSFLN